MQNVAALCHTHGLHAQRGLRLNKNLGQHFLIDEAVLQKIVETAKIQPSDHILEIGAGTGILTKELLQRAGKVTAIELDKKLIPLLKKYVSSDERQVTSDKLTIIQGNALTTPFPIEPYKVVANIPYHITSPLLRHAFLESTVTPSTMTLLIQREVAEKICDQQDHGLLTILVGLFGKPRLMQVVPPASFLPPPKVDSAILHIECFEKPLANRATIEEVFHLTKIAFSQKRKMLRNTIGQLPGGLELLKRVGIEATRRPQALSVKEWIELARLHGSAP